MKRRGSPSLARSPLDRFAPQLALSDRGVPRVVAATVLALVFALSTGCTSVLSPIASVPASRVPPEFLAKPRANLQQIDLARLRQDAPTEYKLDAGDVLAVYIEGVLGQPDDVPPVHYPIQKGDTLPALGYPIPVREDGTLSLPLIDPIPVRGMTVPDVEKTVREIYLEKRQILRAGQDRILVSLVRKRTYRVIVVREDGSNEIALPGGRGGRVISGSAEAGRGFVLDLPAYKNDVLHALAESGGLPGVNALNEVKILRGTSENRAERDALIREFYEVHGREPCLTPPLPPNDPSITRIQLRLPPGETPQFDSDDVILHDGDIVHVESRDTEVFYTGGLMTAGQYPLPRDYDLDVLGAMAIAGRGLGTNSTGSFIGGVGGANPTRLFIIRHTPNNQQLTIAVDLNRAIMNPRERLLIKPGDTLILRHTPVEESVNFGLFTFFTYGMRQLFTQ